MKGCLLSVILLQLLKIAVSKDFFVATPRVLRLDSNETIAVACEGRGTKGSLVIQDYPGRMRNIFKVDFNSSSETSVVPVYLESSLFPRDFLSEPGFPKLVHLSVRMWNEEKTLLIPISFQHGYLFMQTDKPIYKPQELVRMRLISLNEAGRPTKDNIKLQIRNPSGDVVEEKLLQRSLSKELYARNDYRISRYPGFGQWSVSALYGYGFKQNSTVRFIVKEYVLPPFLVHLELFKKVILPSTKEVAVKVKAEYSYGKHVNGNARVLLKNRTLQLGPIKLVKGAADFSVDVGDLYTNFVEVNGQRLKVEATVVDRATGLSVKVNSSEAVFADSPYVILPRRSPSYFRQGLVTFFQVEVIHRDGSPARGVPVVTEVIADGVRRDLIKKKERCDVLGRLSVEVDTNDFEKILLRVKTDDPDIPAESQAVGEHLQTKIGGAGDPSISLSRLGLKWPKPGMKFSTNVHVSPSTINYVFYMVVSRGIILLFDKKAIPSSQAEHVISFTVTEEMAPHLRLVAFAHHGTLLLVDSLKLDVEITCPKDAEVSIKLDKDTFEPGEKLKLTVEGNHWTMVGFLAVDESVYSLSNVEIFDKKKVMKALSGHDMGCGAGSGENAADVLRRAGVGLVTNHFYTDPSISCDRSGNSRHERAVHIDPAEEYSEETLMCCRQGKEKDRFERDCASRTKKVEMFRNVSKECVEAYDKCCRYQFEDEKTSEHWKLVIGKEKDDKDDDDYEDIIDENTEWRQNFEETFMYEDVEIGPDGKEDKGYTLPHTITRWRLQYFSVSPDRGICLGEARTIQSYKKVFLKVNLPYAVVQNEQVEIQATVYNYGKEDIKAQVYMFGEEDLCTHFPPKGYQMKTVEVEKESAVSVTFSAKPLRVKHIPYVAKFHLKAGRFNDSVERTLNVIHEGVDEREDVSVLLDPSNVRRGNHTIVEKRYKDLLDVREHRQVTVLNVSLPDDYVPGTATATILITGNPIGAVIETALGNPDQLIAKPKGCGEQNMIFMGPTLYAMRYLKAAGKMTDQQEAKGYEFIRTGYENELNFKKTDGSYAAFKDRPTSTWLTAFVMKVFCQASKLVFIDPEVLKSGIKWLVDNQGADGSYTETNPVYHPRMMGGVRGKISMTAFALIALEECAEEGQKLLLTRDRALKFLEKHLHTLRGPLETAVASYALALADSDIKWAAKRKLLALTKYDPVHNWLHWVGVDPARAVETAGYGLLTLLRLNDLRNGTLVANFLNKQQLQSGSFKSTQDTVIALQALSEYAIRAQRPALNFTSRIRSSTDVDLDRILMFNEANPLANQRVDIRSPRGLVYVETKGHGTGLASLSLRYKTYKIRGACKFNIRYSIEEEEDFKITNNTSSESSEEGKSSEEEEDGDGGPNLLIFKIWTRHLGNSDTGMGVIQVQMPTGYEPELQSLEKLKNDQTSHVLKYEFEEKTLYFYLPKITTTKMEFKFKMERKLNVSDLSKSLIQIYDYYSDTEVCSTYYSVNSSHSDLATVCEEHQCDCLAGGCPLPDYYFHREFKELRGVPLRKVIKEKACSDFHYVWLGKVVDVLKEDGKLYVTFSISEVFKEGAEAEGALVDSERTLVGMGTGECSPLLEVDAEYLIMGKDGRKFKRSEVWHHRYILNGATAVYRWDEPTEDLLDLKLVLDELKGEEGCGL